MKINIWIEVSPWDINNDGSLKNTPMIQTQPFAYPCSEDIKRFKAVIEIPYVMLPSPVTELEPIKALKED